MSTGARRPGHQVLHKHLQARVPAQEHLPGRRTRLQDLWDDRGPTVHDAAGDNPARRGGPSKVSAGSGPSAFFLILRVTQRLPQGPRPPGRSPN